MQQVRRGVPKKMAKEHEPRARALETFLFVLGAIATAWMELSVASRGVLCLQSMPGPLPYAPAEAGCCPRLACLLAHPVLDLIGGVETHVVSSVVKHCDDHTDHAGSSLFW